MPEISRFLGIVIAMFYRDHPPPHFHAVYGDHEAAIAIRDGVILWGTLPKRALSHVQEWRQRTWWNWRKIGSAPGPGSR